MEGHLELEFRFAGRDADASRLQFYDAAQALVGLERTIALTNHLLLNGEVRTQSPGTKGFQTFLLPPEEGSWKAGIGVFFGAALAAGVASKDSALGYLAISALDYVIQDALGLDAGFDDTLADQLREAHENELLPERLDRERFDSLIEKVEPGLIQCHRPIVFSETASNAQINFKLPHSQGTLKGFFDAETYQYAKATITRDDLEDFVGVVSSYNVNTFRGRLYLRGLSRTVPFELSDQARGLRSQRMIAGSLYENSSKEAIFPEEITLRGFRNVSVNDRLKKIFVVEVNPVDPL